MPRGGGQKLKRGDLRLRPIEARSSWVYQNELRRRDTMRVLSCILSLFSSSLKTSRAQILDSIYHTT